MSFSTFSQFTDSVLLHIRLNLRRRDIPVSRKSLARCNARHLRIKRLVQFIFVGAVYHNALSNCAALLCRTQRRVAHMCSSTVSDTANRLRKTRKKKSSAVPLFRSGHMSAICARLSKGKGRFTRGWKPQVSTLLCARAASAQCPRRNRRRSLRFASKTLSGFHRKIKSQLPRIPPLS